jgi:hypothetical protein
MVAAMLAHRAVRGYLADGAPGPAAAVAPRGFLTAERILGPGLEKAIAIGIGRLSASQAPGDPEAACRQLFGQGS